jgi:hypothetical protein
MYKSERRNNNLFMIFRQYCIPDIIIIYLNNEHDLKKELEEITRCFKNII